MQGSYCIRSSLMSTFHFFSIGPWAPDLLSISPSSEATPNTLHEGYSLHARVKTGGLLGSPESPLGPPDLPQARGRRASPTTPMAQAIDLALISVTSFQ